MKDTAKTWCLALFSPVPAILMGGFVMHSNHIRPMIYTQNIACYLVLALILSLLGKKLPAAAVYNWAGLLLFLFVGLVACTFLDEGISGVHRWITVGGLGLYVSSSVAPGMLIGLGWQLEKGKSLFPTGMITLMVFLLAMQPDAAQASAFAVASLFLPYTQPKGRPLRWAMAGICLGVVVYVWVTLDGLQAVPHVEDIVFLAWEMGGLWFVLGIVCLCLLLIPFLFILRDNPCARAVGVYYLVVLVSTIFGNFPVVVMGFGISPIAGYLLAIFLLCHIPAPAAQNNLNPPGAFPL